MAKVTFFGGIRAVLVCCIAAIFILGLALPASALPILQVYIEGASYDHDTGTWVASTPDFTLWVIGDTGQNGTILDVQLSAAFLTGETGSISISPTTAGSLSDPSTPSAPVLDPTVGADGTLPLMSDGSPLPSRGVYGPGTSFMQWGLGDFDLTDSPIGDFSGGFPTSFPSAGQINAYDISISGYSMVHFDTFNHVESPSSILIGPYASSTSVVPEPGSYLLFSLGLMGLAAARARRRFRRR